MSRILCLIGLVFSLAIFAAGPDVPQQYKGFFKKYSTERSLYSEKIAPMLGSAKAGRSFAIVAGVWQYQFDNLTPAKVDIENMVNYLINEEHFDEVVVLTNEQVNYENFRFFLQSYFKERVQKYPQSRFLFAYSGHGSLDGSDGYLVKSSATSLQDLNNSIGVDVLRPLIKRVMDQSHHTLVLLNACHAGSFLSYSFGDKQYLPKKRGAHAITAGGTNELTYSIPSVGEGSVFYEVLLDGVRGAADSIPSGGDGIVTFNELFGYIHNKTSQITSSQVPRSGDLRPGNDSSEGSFFFLDKDIKVTDTTIIEKLVDAIPFGDAPAITYLFAEPSVIVRGDSSKISWESKNAQVCSFSDNDVQYRPTGSRTLSPISTTELILNCSVGQLSSTKQITLTVLPPPLIKSFKVSKLEIEEGQTTELSWSVDNAQECSIDNGIGTVPLDGNILIAPTVTKQYSLFCTTQNVQKSAVVQISVKKARPVCDESQKLVGDRCVSRCEYGEEWYDGACEAICDSSERYVNGACEPRCARDQTWNGSRCETIVNQPSSKFQSGYIIRYCGCWGYINMGTIAPEQACASGQSIAVACNAYCPAGGYQWGIQCL